MLSALQLSAISIPAGRILIAFIGTALFWLYVRGAKPKRKLQPAI